MQNNPSIIVDRSLKLENGILLLLRFYMINVSRKIIRTVLHLDSFFSDLSLS